jgi:hypothetical protein
MNMPFAPEEKVNRRERVFEAMGGWHGKHEIEEIVSDRAKVIRNIEFWQKQIDDLEKEFDKPGMDNSRARTIDKIQARNKKFLAALRPYLAVLEEETATATS